VGLRPRPGLTRGGARVLPAAPELEGTRAPHPATATPPGRLFRVRAARSHPAPPGPRSPQENRASETASSAARSPHSQP
jgi:hypothetical protein